MKTTTLSRLSGKYRAALRTFLEQDPRSGLAGLAAAREMGQQAVAMDLGTLELAKMHEDALAVFLRAGGAADGREAVTARAAAIFAVANRSPEKAHRLARATDGADHDPRATGAQAATLLAEAVELQQHLEALARQILTAQEEERKKMSLTLQDEIAQTLLGIHVRLLALQREVAAGGADFQNEIAATRQLVLESVKIINCYAGELDIPHEH